MTLCLDSVVRLRLREMLRAGDRFWLRIEGSVLDAPDESKAASEDAEGARELVFSLVAADAERSEGRAREFASGRLRVDVA